MISDGPANDYNVAICSQIYPENLGGLVFEYFSINNRVMQARYGGREVSR